MNIAILGATSHIAKGLIERFLGRGDDHLFLFARSTEKIRQFLDTLGTPFNDAYTLTSDFTAFSSYSYDLIINCIGVETRNRDNCDFTRYFSVTEEYDNLVINHLKSGNPEALYISFSSGAVYGRGFPAPVDDAAVNPLQINHIAQEDYYGIVRINAEAKHRAHLDLNIVDLRIFSYFSRFINLSDGYFITDVMQAVMNGKVLITDDINIVRDYLHPDDLFAMILCCADAGHANRAFDVSSSHPVTKQEILDYFTSKYALQYETRHVLNTSPATGTKTNYYSISTYSSTIGYKPRFSSIDTITDGAEHILSNMRIS